MLVNTGTSAVSYSQLFFDPTGTPQSFAVQAQQGAPLSTASAIVATVAASSTVSFVLPDSDSPTPKRGWSLLTYDSKQGTLTGYAILRHKAANGAFSFEAVLPVSNMQDYSSYMPFDNTHGFRTEMTLVNPAANLGAPIALRFLNSDGNVLFVDSITLQPGEQTTLSLPDTYPDLANKVGAVVIMGGTNRLSVTGIRYDPTFGAIAAVPWFAR